MRFLVQLSEPDHFARWAALADDERAAFMSRLEDFEGRVAERGAVVAGEGLADPSTAATVRDGVASDGPYAETVEQLGGFYVIDVASREVALDLVQELSRGISVEVRPVVES